MPEPIIDSKDGTDPEHEALIADSVGLALLVVLETLTPAERLAFVLHDMFGVPFDQIARVVDRSPDAARQLASRARRRVRAENAEPDVDLDAQREVVEAFLAAAREGDFARLLAILDPDVVLRADFGPDAADSLPRGPRRAKRSPARRPCTRGSASRCTGARQWRDRVSSPPGTASRSRWAGSPSAVDGSSRWTSWPIRRAAHLTSSGYVSRSSDSELMQ